MIGLPLRVPPLIMPPANQGFTARCLNTREHIECSGFAKILERALSGKPSSIQQIDIEHEGDRIVAWVYFKPADDDCFAGFVQARGQCQQMKSDAC
jgi:hypothetical protein